MEFEKFPETIKIIHELKCLLIGMRDGEMKIYKWPFLEQQDNFKNLISRDFLMYRTNLHFGSIIDIQVMTNLSYIFTASNDASVYYNEYFVKQAGEYNYYNKLYDYVGPKPKIDKIINISDLFHFKIDEIRDIDSKVENLIKNKNLLEKSNKDHLEIKRADYEEELKALENQKKEAIEEENRKLQTLFEDIKEMKQNVEQELQLRQEDHEEEKNRLQLKYDEKLKLYKNEIDRLNTELRELENTIEDKFKSLAFQQNDSFNNLFNDYLNNFSCLREEIELNIEILVKTNAEYDDALDKGRADYERLIQKLKDDMAMEIDTAQKIIEEKKLQKAKVLSEENNLKSLLDQKVAESDDIIMKNVQIKQNIIDTTQRSITLQEQLLETEKNLIKIDKKMEDLQNKNNHLEQIRFVLEHRMAALEKEKGPLEDQCYFLENQKYSLQSEFNRLILEISKKNQNLENKQAQLKASLIQNFEINDHIKYMKKKLNHLQGEVSHFIKKFHDNNMKNMSIQEKKATTVALHLRNFYFKYFETNIDHELLNYKYYSQKLQEESDKINISNNVDLMLRDKGEEKILNENFKMEQITQQREKGFKRMQDENTILISECNRLRKNLHEVYMHVIDIEKKFEDLTKINPTLNKTEIVSQIKNFIKKTHHVIKNKYDEHYLEQVNINTDHSGNSKYNTFYKQRETSILDLNGDVNGSTIYQGDLLKNLNSNQNNLIDQKSNLEAMNNQIIRAMTPTIPNEEFKKTNDYENFLILPEIKNQNTINANENIEEFDGSNKRVNTHSEKKNSEEYRIVENTDPKSNLPKI